MTGLEAGPSSVSALRAAVREETLGDRIGERIRSRLREMCVPLELHGLDFRQGIRCADSA
jgi:DNA replication protein DnaC